MLSTNYWTSMKQVLSDIDCAALFKSYANYLFHAYRHDLCLLAYNNDASLLLGRLAVAIESHGRQFMAVRWSSRPIQRSLYSAITHFHLKQSYRPPIRHFRHGIVPTISTARRSTYTRVYTRVHTHTYTTRDPSYVTKVASKINMNAEQCWCLWEINWRIYTLHDRLEYVNMLYLAKKFTTYMYIYTSSRADVHL